MDNKKMTTPSTENEQDGRKMTRDMANLDHLANDIINPHWQSAQNEPNPPHAGDHAPSKDTRAVGEVKGTKGSGTRILSGAGQLADDRPGRDEPKSDHASSSLNTHE
jgi:hypothetical protein